MAGIQRMAMTRWQIPSCKTTSRMPRCGGDAKPEEAGIPALGDDDGSALTAVTVLILLVTLSVGIVMAAEVLRVRAVQVAEHRLAARYAAEEGLARMRAVLDSQTPEDAQPVDLVWGWEGDTARVQARPFGGFWHVVSEGERRRARHYVEALLVDEAGAEEALSRTLLLADSTGGLTLVDTVRIEGVAEIGSAGLHEGGAGLPFRGRRPDTVRALPRGELPHANLPALEFALAQTLAGRLEVKATPATLSDVLAQVPASPRVIQLPPGSVLRGPLRFSPYEVIASEGSLAVEGDVAFNRTLILARDSLRVGAGASGDVQLFCWGRVRLDGPLALSYPSVVAALPYEPPANAGEEDLRAVDVRGSARLDGTLLEVSSADPARQIPRHVARLGPGFYLRGGMFSTGYVQVRGRVDGSLVAYSTQFYRAPTLYLGWMNGGDLSLRRRPSPFGTIFALRKGQAQTEVTHRRDVRPDTLRTGETLRPMP